MDAGCCGNALRPDGNYTTVADGVGESTASANGGLRDDCSNLTEWFPNLNLWGGRRRERKQDNEAVRNSMIESDADLPKFAPISTNLAKAGGQGKNTTIQSKLWEAFTPSRPKYSGRFFAGRRAALQRVITAIEQDQSHIVIFGPRGIGKTSFGNVLAECARASAYQILRYPCGSSDTFEEVFRSLLRDLPIDNLRGATQARLSGIDNLEKLLPEGEFGPNDLEAILSQIAFDHAIFVIDEFDRAKSPELKNQLAEAIKNLSDASARVTLIIIGVAHSLDELIGMHPSIRRHVLGVPLPLMTPLELAQTIQAGEEASGMQFEAASREAIVSLSKGLPYFAQLLSLYSGRQALDRGSTLIEVADLREALKIVVQEIDPVVKASYEAATRDETDEYVLDLLMAAAVSPFDDFGTFTAENCAKVYVNRRGEIRPEIEIFQALEDFASQDHLRLIEKCPLPTVETRYAFVLQIMRQYILLRQGVRCGLI